MKKKSNYKSVVIAIIIIILIVLSNLDFENIFKDEIKRSSNTLIILSSPENKDLEPKVQEFAKENGLRVEFVYMGDIDIVSELNTNSESYDAVWISNSMWLYMLENSYLTSESKSVSVSPVVIGIRQNKAKELGLIGRDITNTEFLNLIQNKQLSYVMNSVTSTNTGATAYFGFVNSLAGNPEVLTKDMLDDPTLQNSLINLFSGVARVSGDEYFLESMFINNDKYEAVIADESSLININKKLRSQGKEELYLFYPSDGVAMNDSTIAFIDNGYENKEAFLKVQKYLLSDKGQKYLQEKGRRTWYGGVNDKADKSVFNPDWGINTNKYLNVTKYPSKDVMTYALNVYIELLRKPSHTVFVLDFSGSMLGDGYNQLLDAMTYILDYEEASKDRLQFSEKDKITIIPFSSYVDNPITTYNGKDTSLLLDEIKYRSPNGQTALYDAVIKALSILDYESEEYTLTIIAMTDGAVNVGTYYEVERYYKSIEKDIPIYGILFGDAREDELLELAELSNAKVFDGRTDLLKAFKEVRGYN